MQGETFVTNILNPTVNIHGYPSDITFRANIDEIIANKLNIDLRWLVFNARFRKTNYARYK